MSLASDKLETIRQQVQFHLDHAEQKKLSADQERDLVAQIKTRLVKENAVLIAHYYTAPAIQALAEETGGCVSDSLEMARFGHDHPAQTLVVAGVKFMGETQNSYPWQTCIDANSRGDLLSRPGLPCGRVF